MTPMSVCVVGWYLDKFDDFYMTMHKVNKKHPVHVVAHRDSPYLRDMDLPYTLRENVGLEWGAYNHYLMHVWDGEGNVLFCHDDIIFHPLVVGDNVLPPEGMFDNIAAMGVDQAYIFSSRAEDVENASHHGRMVFCSKSFLQTAKELGGFFFDPKNRGYTDGSKPEVRAEMGCLGYNAGIIAFHSQAAVIGKDVHRRAYVPSFGLAVRGEEKSEKVTYGKFLAQAADISKAAHDRLHLGCGENYMPGFVNVDLHDPGADVRADVRSLPFEDGSFDWVESHHLIEHLTHDDAVKAITEWRRVLRPGGHMFLSCPDLVSCVATLKDATFNPALWEGFARAVYGTDEPGMKHQFGYCRESLEATMKAAGFNEIEVKTAIGYRPTPSLIGICRKEQ